MQLEFLTSVDSTMAYLQRLPDDVTTDDLYVVVAETQTAGRASLPLWHWSVAVLYGSGVRCIYNNRYRFHD